MAKTRIESFNAENDVHWAEMILPATCALHNPQTTIYLHGEYEVRATIHSQKNKILCTPGGPWKQRELNVNSASVNEVSYVHHVRRLPLQTWGPRYHVSMWSVQFAHWPSVFYNKSSTHFQPCTHWGHTLSWCTRKAGWAYTLEARIPIISPTDLGN